MGDFTMPGRSDAAFDDALLEHLLDTAHRLTESAAAADAPHAADALRLARAIYAFASARGSAEAARRLFAQPAPGPIVDPDDLDWVAPQGG